MTITIGTYNNTMIKADDTGYFSLTDMWKANGCRNAQRPGHWLELPNTAKLLEVLGNETNVGKSDIDLVKTQRGGKMPGTWGLQKVAIAYAEYLSPEFHAWVLDAVSAFVHMEENPEEGLSRYAEQSIKALRKAGRSDTYIMERIEGIAIRKMMDSTARNAGVKNQGMATLSTNINRAVTGMTPGQLRKERNVKRTRDGLSLFELQMIKTIEAAGCDMFKQTSDGFTYFSDRDAINKMAPLLQQVSTLVSTIKK